MVFAFKNSPSDHGIYGGQKQLKKFMQVEVGGKCMRTNFGECSLSHFEDNATFKNGQNSLSDHGHSPWSSKNLAT